MCARNMKINIYLLYPLLIDTIFSIKKYFKNKSLVIVFTIYCEHGSYNGTAFPAITILRLETIKYIYI